MNYFTRFNYYQWLIIGGFFCLLLQITAYILQYGLGLIPCPLCLLQRYIFWVIALLCFIAATHKKARIGRYFYCVGIIILASLGGLIASWQIWLQHLPPEQLPPCSASIASFFKYYPFLDAIKLSLYSPEECGKVTFSIFGLTLAHGALFSFLILFILGFRLLFLIKKERN